MKKLLSSLTALVLSVFLLGFSSSREADREPATEKLPCINQVQTQLQQWGVLGEWEKKLSTKSDVPNYVSPTQNLGVWVELDRSDLEKGPIARKIAFDRNVSITWSPETCAPKMVGRDNKYNLKALRGAFTDEYLKQITQNNAKGLIFAWSPHMPYSQPGIENIRKAAAELNVPVFLVLDPKADERGVAQAKKAWGLQDKDIKRMESVELLYRGLLNHFPGAIAFKDQKVIQSGYVGLKTESEYVTYFKKVLGG